MIYVFDDCTLNTHLYTIQRAEQITPLRPKVFQVLLYLLEHRDKVVSKHELAEQVWPEQFIADATLESTVRGLRQALGDSGKAQRIIRTLPGHGYRFVAPLSGPYQERDDDNALARDADPCLPEPSTPERRQLTVMACDLVDAMQLSEQLDYDDFHALVKAYKQTCADVMQQFDGYMTENISTGLLVYFGYPYAHEDDAQRAIRAGLALIEAVTTFNEGLEDVVQTTGMQVAVRLGIHTGMVVVGGDQNRGDPAKTFMLGEAPSTVVQIQGMATPNTVVISDTTARLVQGHIIRRSLGHHMLSGLADPMQLFRVLSVRNTGDRFDLLGPEAQTPLVGRDGELRLLLDRWQQAKDGLGQVVLLNGEAGIGKSRLLRAIKDGLAEDAHYLIELRCSSYHLNSALYPIIDLFQRMLHWEPDDSPEERLGKLEALLTDYALPLNTLVPLLSGLLSLPCPEDPRYTPPSVEPQKQRQELLEAILTIVLTLAAAQPVLLTVEDLHWMDPSTEELLTLLIEHVPTRRICALLTYRPSFHVPWPSRSYTSQITLARLSHEDVEKIVTHLTHGKSLPADVMSQVVYNTDGIPLFIEEFTKALLEAAPLQEGNDRYELLAPLEALTIPTTLHDSLMARLDRLQEGKRVAQVGGVIGRQFSYALLQAVWEEDERLLERGVAKLLEAELIYQQGLPSQVTYIFKHALVQEAAAQSLLKRTRQHYHMRTARALTEEFPETVASHPELLAHHYTEAGQGEQAIPYWEQAGQRALERSANVEAISHFTKGLELLKSLPAMPEYARQELELQLGLGSVLRMVKGHTALEVKGVYTRAHELSKQVGDSRQQFSVLVSLWRFYLSQAKLQTAHELAEQCFTFAQHMQDPELLQDAYRMLGLTSFYQGEPLSARVHLEHGMALYDTEQGRLRALRSGMDPGVSCLSYLAWTLWLLGYPDQARARSNEALTLAQQLSHAYSLNFALAHDLIISASCRDMQSVREQADATIVLARQQGFVRWLAVGTAWSGWALAEQGEAQKGIGQMCQAVDMWQAMGGDLRLPQILIIKLAEAYGKGGQAEEGLCVLAEAWAEVHENEERRFEAELYRCQGELLLQSGVWGLQSAIRNPQLVETENCFRQAIDVACSQHAKSLELRAVMSLSRLWQQQDKRQEARAMLEAIYSWFTEGFDTLDLQEAKALLEALQ